MPDATAPTERDREQIEDLVRAGMTFKGMLAWVGAGLETGLIPEARANRLLRAIYEWVTDLTRLGALEEWL